MGEILTALKALPELIKVVNTLIQEVQSLRQASIDRAVKEKIVALESEIHKLKQAETDEELKIAIDSIYNAIYK